MKNMAFASSIPICTQISRGCGPLGVGIAFSFRYSERQASVLIYAGWRRYYSDQK